MATTRKRTTRSKKAEESQAKAILENVKNLKPEDVIADIGNLQVGLQGTLAGISAEISNKIEQMQHIDEAISLKNQELKELYEIETEATSLEDIKAQKEQAVTDFEKEEADREARWAEDENQRRKRWSREEDDHRWTVRTQQRQMRDEFELQMNLERKNEEDRKDALAKEWAQREDALASREKELEELREKVAGFDNHIKTEVSKAEAILSNRIKKDFEHKIQLVEMEKDAQLALNHAQVESMKETIEDLEEQIDNLQSQLVSARSDAREVTAEALRSASGRDVAVALQRVVDQGTSTSSKSK